MAAVTNTWSVAQETALIEFWENKPYLWDPKHSDYYVKELRKCTIQVAIDLLGRDVNGLPFTETSIKKKIKQLRDLLVRELKKEEGSKKPGSATTSKYFSKWRHFKRLQYLRRTLKADISLESTNDNTESCATIASVGEPSSPDDSFVVMETEETDGDLQENMHTPSKRARIQKRSEPLSAKDAMFIKAIELMNQMPKTVSSEDLFGMFVANALQKFDSRNQAKIKLDIHQILFDYEIGKKSK